MRDLWLSPMSAEVAAFVENVLGQRQLCELTADERNAVLAEALAKYMARYPLKPRKTGLQPPG